MAEEAATAETSDGVDQRRTTALSTGGISFIFCLLGIGSLMPWNAFINADEYFQSRLCSESSSDDGSSVELWFGLVFNVTGALALGVLLAVDRYREKSRSHRNVTREQVSSDDDQMSWSQEDIPDTSDPNSHYGKEEGHSRRMVYYSLSAYLAVFLLTTALVLVPRIKRSLFLSLTLSGIGICGASMAVTGAGVTAVAAMFPPEIGISSYFSGQAIGGLVVAIANLIAAAAEPPQKFIEEHCGHNEPDSVQHRWLLDQVRDCPAYAIDLASFSYFGLGCFFLLVCLVGFRRLDRHIRCSNSTEVRSIEGGVSEDSSDSNTSRDDQSTESMQSLDGAADASMDLAQSLLGENGGIDGDDRSSRVGSTAAVWSAIRLPALSIFITLFVVIVITPSWVVNIRSTGRCRGGRLQNDLFVPFLFVVFNAGDLAGRIVAGKTNTEKVRNLPQKLFAASIFRIAFLPLFLLCSSSNSGVSVSIETDAYPISLLFLLAITNGFMMNMCFMLFPRLLPNDELLQEIGSTIMNFSLALGLLCGSFFSFVFLSIGT